ncbi:hypothetical protein OIO90_001009 [Microbotryomycetes sp. JL221]|nr:hypothetical protein OIO90_001009 [Microbotryomycetes sp. JL221]
MVQPPPVELVIRRDDEPCLYEIRECVDAGYMGAFARLAIKKGSIVLCERPLLTLDAPLQSYLFQRIQSGGSSGPTPIQGDSDEDEEEPTTLEQFLDQNITRQLKLKHVQHQQQFWDLANTRPELPKAYGIFATNAVSTVDETGGMFLTLSRFNSGCRPCLSRPQYDPKTKTFTLTAVRDVHQGEELTWPYLGIPFEFDSVQHRRQELLQCFHFNCLCSACQQWLTNPDKLKESNQRLLRLRRLKQQGLNAKWTVEEMIKLCHEEQLWEMKDTLQQQLETL